MKEYKLVLFSWILLDVALFIIASALAYFIRTGMVISTDYVFSYHMLATLLAIPFVLASLLTTRCYALTRNQESKKSIAYIIYSAFLGIAAFTLAYYFMHKDLFSRLLLLQMFLLSSMLLIIGHVFFQKLIRSLFWNQTIFPTLIIGANRESKDLIKRMQSMKHPYKPVAILDGKGSKESEIHGVTVKGKLNKLEDVLQEDRITHMIQCSDLEQSLNLLGACRNHNITYMLLPSVLGVVERDERIESIAGQPVTMVSTGEKKWWWFFR